MARSRIREDQVLDSDFLSHYEHDYETPHYFRDLADVTTYSGTGVAGQFVKVRADGSGLEYGTVSGTQSYVMQKMTQNPTYDGVVNLLGWYYIIDSDVSLSSGSPITVSEHGYNSFFVTNVKSTTGAPFTMRFTGTTVNRVTDATTTGNTCDITVSGTGYYMTGCPFINNPQVSIVEGGKSCTLDIYRVSQCAISEHMCTLAGCDLIWTPDQTNWLIHIIIYHVMENGELYVVDDINFDKDSSPQRAFALYSGRYIRSDYNREFDADKNEGIVVWADQRAIGNFVLTLTGHTEESH
jgi:hypothetical protein